MDRAALANRGGSDDRAGLDHGLADERDIARAGLDQPGIDDRAAANNRDLGAERRCDRIADGAEAGAQNEITTGRQNGLAVAACDRAVIAHIAAQQPDEAAVIHRGLRRVGGDPRTRLDHDAGGRTGKACGIAGRARRAEQPGRSERRIGNGGGRGDQSIDVGLRTGTEQNAVSVEHQHLAPGGDRAQDAARLRRRVVDAIEYNPVVGARTAGALIECQRRGGADIERFPVQYGLGLSLHDIHRHAARRRHLHRQRSARPQW